jgi:ribosomal protection tetracycline resistance protein
VEFSPGIERGNLPPAFIAATEEGVRVALRQGLFGWEVTDCVVTMTNSGYWPRQSHAHQKFNKAMSSVGADFRNLAPVVLMAALAAAGTQVCQPVDRFELEVPDTALNAVAAEIGRLGAETLHLELVGSYARLTGTVPSSQVPDVTHRLPDLTGGEGVLVTALDHYAPVGGRPRVRRRVGIDPRDRRTWFRDVPR